MPFEYLVYSAVMSVVATGTIIGFIRWQRRPDASKHRGANALILLVVTILFGGSVLGLMRWLGADSALVGAFVALLAPGWVNFLHAVVPLRLPRILQAVEPARRATQLERLAGVTAFGAGLRRTPLRHLNPMVYLSPAVRAPGAVARALEEAEAVHLWGIVVTLPYLVPAAVRGAWPAMAGCLAMHVIFNVYPIAHLRLARARLRAFRGRCGGPHSGERSPNRLMGAGF